MAWPHASHIKCLKNKEGVYFSGSVAHQLCEVFKEWESCISLIIFNSGSVARQLHSKTRIFELR